MAKDLLQKAAAEQMQKQNPDQKAKQSINQIMNAMLDGEKLRGRFEELLGKRTPQFFSSVVSLINASPDLQEAFYNAPMSVLQSCLRAASYDLPIDPTLGYAYIAPFYNTVKDKDGREFKRKEAEFIIGWRGMYQLAMRSAVYKKLNVTDIREGELVQYNKLTEDIEINFIEDEEEREKRPVIGYAGYHRLINGAEKTIYMTKKQIDAHELHHRKGKYMTKAWRTDYDSMARKTVYRQLIGKYGVMSIDYRTAPEAARLAEAISEDERQYARDSFLPEENPLPDHADAQEAEFEDVTQPEVDTSTGEVMEQTTLG